MTLARRCFAASLLGALLALSSPARAAGLSEMAIWPLVDLIWSVVGILGGMAMLLAGFLFLRMGRYQAVFVCLAIQTIPGILSRTFLFFFKQSPDLLSTYVSAVMSLISGAVTVAQLAALVVAGLLFAKTRAEAPSGES